MSFLPNQERPTFQFYERPNPLTVAYDLKDQQGTTTHTVWAAASGAYKQVIGLVHVLKCDTCGNECQNDAVPDYERYVPDAWKDLGNETHECPDCQSIKATGHSVGCWEQTKGEHPCTCHTIRARMKN